jgi:hypothetical protein
MKPKRWYVIVTVPAVLLCLAGRSPADQDQVVDSWIARFEAPQQSIWSSGGSGFAAESDGSVSYANSFSYQDFGIGVTVEAGYNVFIDSGHVTGNVEGRIQASHPNYVASPGPVDVGLSYAPIEDESQLHTRLGVSAEGSATISVDISDPFPLIDVLPPWSRDYMAQVKTLGFDWTSDFTGELNQPVELSGETPNFAEIGVGLAFGGLNIGAHLYQEISFEPLEIAGTLGYEHMETGVSYERDFTITDDAMNVVSLDLDMPGHWLVTLENVNLVDNSFSQVIQPEVDGYLLIFGLGAVWVKTTRFPLGVECGPFPLDFDGVDMLGRFDIYVDSAPAAVPLPGSVLLAGFGLSIVGWCRVRRMEL